MEEFVIQSRVNWISRISSKDSVLTISRNYSNVKVFIHVSYPLHGGFSTLSDPLECQWWKYWLNLRVWWKCNNIARMDYKLRGHWCCGCTYYFSITRALMLCIWVFNCKHARHFFILQNYFKWIETRMECFRLFNEIFSKWIEIRMEYFRIFYEPTRTQYDFFCA